MGVGGAHSFDFSPQALFPSGMWLKYQPFHLYPCFGTIPPLTKPPCAHACPQEAAQEAAQEAEMHPVALREASQRGA